MQLLHFYREITRFIKNRVTFTWQVNSSFPRNRLHAPFYITKLTGFHCPWSLAPFFFYFESFPSHAKRREDFQRIQMRVSTGPVLKVFTQIDIYPTCSHRRAPKPTIFLAFDIHLWMEIFIVRRIRAKQSLHAPTIITASFFFLSPVSASITPDEGSRARSLPYILVTAPVTSVKPNLFALTERETERKESRSTNRRFTKFNRSTDIILDWVWNWIERDLISSRTVHRILWLNSADSLVKRYEL